MSLTKLLKDIAYHQKQLDEPNDVGGLTAEQFKALCDQAAVDIKDYINNILTVEAENSFALRDDLNNLVLGQVPLGSITDDRLSNEEGQLKDKVNELFTSVSNGKTSVASAITNKGVSASPEDTFSLLAEKIGQINTGYKAAKGNFTVNGADITVAGLGFKPNFLAIKRDNNYRYIGLDAFPSETIDNAISYYGIRNGSYVQITLTTTANNDGFTINYNSTSFPNGTWEFIAVEYIV